MPDENLESLFKSWLVEHGGAVLKVARAYTLTTEDCQDLAQEILLQVWRSLPQFQGRASTSTWSYRGRFRAFLLTAFKHFLSKQREKARAETRRRPSAAVARLCRRRLVAER